MKPDGARAAASGFEKLSRQGNKMDRDEFKARLPCAYVSWPGLALVVV